jgi:hypothetical protein
MLSKITSGFGKQDNDEVEETKQEKTVPKVTEIKCLIDRISLMLNKLSFNDHQYILDQLYGKLYQSKNFTYWNEFKSNML